MGNYFWESDAVRLRPLEDRDVEVFLASDRDSDGKRTLNLAIGLPRNAAIQAEQLAVNFKHAPERLDFAIETTAADEFAGLAAIDRINEQNGTFSTVTFVFEAFRRRGFATQAKEIMLAWMFQERRFQKYESDCVASNAAIISHLRKLGCTEEGRRRRHVYTNGRFEDELLFGMTVEEYRAQRGLTAQ